MQKTISDILRSPNFNSKTRVSGWVRTKRCSKNVSFIALNDGSTIKNLQVVAEANDFDDNLIKNISKSFGIRTHFLNGNNAVDIFNKTKKI